MRVLIYGFSGKILGGIETFILNMNEHMSKDTIFDYVIDGDVCVYSERIEKRGGKIFFVPGVRKNPLSYIKTFWRTLGEQRKEGTNLFYVQLFSMANMLPVFLAKLRGYKVILHAHNNGLQSKGRIYKMIHLLGKALTRKGNYIRFTNSQLSSDFMFGKGVKSELIYNAIDTDKFSFRQEWRDATRDEMASGNNTVIGFVGRLSRQKNPLFMLEIFAEYHKLNPNSELWIVGEGELKEDMNKKIDSLKILPFVKWLGRRNDVEKLMCGMDLLLQPSLFEGLGIVLIEAQATGLMCITSKTVVPQESKVSNRICFISLDKSYSAWASLIAEILMPYKSNRDFEILDFNKHFCLQKESKVLEGLLENYENK